MILRRLGKKSGELLGKTEPRIWTKPLRELTAETSHGFSVISFASVILGIELYPWQQWLLIHALELNEDGTYRFRKIFVLVGRQNGKTTLLTVLTLWWLFMDSESFPEHLPAEEFLILGTAQNLDLAEEAWNSALKRCDPFPDEDDAHFVVPDLAAETRRPVKTNGKKSLRLKNGAMYEPRAASRMGGRGKSSARVLMDEMREQRTWDIWGSVSKTKNAIFNSQLWGISSAGDEKSVVLSTLRDGQIEAIADWDSYVEKGIQSVEEYAFIHDLATALFEWSAPEDSALLDTDAILQANPSIGYKPMFYESILSDLLGDEPESVKRTEILCQWVTSRVNAYIDSADWRGRQVALEDLVIPHGSRTVWGVDVSADRSTTWLSAAVYTEDGKPFATVRTKRAGMMWLVPYLTDLAEQSGHWEVALQARGCPAMEFIEPLEKAGFTVHKLEGGTFALATGRMKDRVRDERLVIVKQPAVDLAIEGGQVKKYAENLGWDRWGSPVDIAGVIAETVALYALEELTPEETEIDLAPPPQAGVVKEEFEVGESLNLATVHF